MRLRGIHHRPIHLAVPPQFTINQYSSQDGQVLVKVANKDHLVGVYPTCACGQGHTGCFTGTFPFS